MLACQPQPTPFQDLNSVLAALIEGLNEVLAGDFVGAYLNGSFAIGDFDDFSDADFIVVTGHDVTKAQLEGLLGMHAHLFEMKNRWAKHLEGSYFPQHILNKPEAVGIQRLWYLDNTHKVLEPSTHDNTWVVRWMTRERGIVLAGLPPKTLIDEIHPTALRHEVIELIRSWGAQLLKKPEQMNNRWRQPFVVLSFCRMLQTVETGTVHSKLTGARWAQATLAPRWSGLIQRAWDDRPDPSAKALLPADQMDLRETLAFVRDIMAKFRS